MSEYQVSTNYPNVVRTSDPLLIRVDKFTLHVNDIVYHAKIVLGNLLCGYRVFVGGINNCMYEHKDEAITLSWARQDQQASSAATQEKQVRERLEDLAKEWMDKLEEAIAVHKGDNEIKKAIDRLTWQVHYDITKSSTDFPSTFPDFADVAIDTPNNGTIRDMLGAVSGSIDTAATKISGADASATQGGSLYGIMDKIGSVSDKLYSANSDTCISARINKVATNIKGDNEQYTISRALRDPDDTDYSVSGATYEQTQLEAEQFASILSHIGEPLDANGNVVQQSGDTWRGDTLFDAVYKHPGFVGYYTSEFPSASLPQGNSSFASATKQYIIDPVGHIEERIGTPSTGSTVWSELHATKGVVDTIKTTTDSTDTTVGTINSTVGTINTTVGTINTTVGTIASDVGTIKTRTTSTRSGKEIGDMVSDVYKAMWGDGVDTYGFVGWVDHSTYYVKSHEINP